MNRLLFIFLLLFLFAVSPQTIDGQIGSDADRAAKREADLLHRTFEAMHQQSVLTPVLPIDAPIPEDAPRFSTRAGCVAALGFAAVGGQGRLVCRVLIDRFPFEGADPTPARIEMMSLPAFSDRG